MWAEDVQGEYECRAGFIPHCYCRKCLRAYEAKKEARCVREALWRAVDKGQHIFTGNVNCGIDVRPEQLKQILTRFGDNLRPLGKWRYFLELNPSDPQRVHLHFTMISDKGIDDGIIKGHWHDALGEMYIPGKPSVSFQRVQSIKATAKYITGDTRIKRKSPLIAKGIGIDRTGGSRNFFGMSKAKLYSQLCEEDGQYARRKCAEGLMVQDTDILEHPFEEYYLILAQQLYEESRPYLRRYDIDTTDEFILDRFTQADTTIQSNPVVQADATIAQADCPDATATIYSICYKAVQGQSKSPMVQYPDRSIEAMEGSAKPIEAMEGSAIGCMALPPKGVQFKNASGLSARNAPAEQEQITDRLWADDAGGSVMFQAMTTANWRTKLDRRGIWRGIRKLLKSKCNMVVEGSGFT